jgi:hypothetical protein
MNKKNLLILGGYGGVGRSLSQLILKETNVNLIIAGRRVDKANEFAQILKAKYSNRVSSRYADASDLASLDKAFHGIDIVIVTATTPEYLEQIAKSALKVGCDCLDILVQQDTIRKMQSLSSEIKNAHCVFITQAGFHPGLPAVFIRHASQYFDDYRKAVIYMAMNVKFEKPESTYEVIRSIAEYNTEIFKNGNWEKITFKNIIKNIIPVDFGTRFGIKKCTPLQMEEIKSLPENYGLKETGVYVAGFNWFVDNFIFPLIMILKVTKGLGIKIFGNLLFWGINKLSSPEEGVVFILDAEGNKKKQERKVRIIAQHEDGYFFTAVPVVACLKQYLEGKLKKPGLWLMGNLVDADRLIKDMVKMGITIDIHKSI